MPAPIQIRLLTVLVWSTIAAVVKRMAKSASAAKFTQSGKVCGFHQAVAGDIGEVGERGADRKHLACKGELLNRDEDPADKDERELQEC